MTVLAVAPLVLPPEGGLHRDLALPEALRLPESWLGYDATTFAYDCIHRPDERAVVLACPPLLNLWGLVTDGALTIDGRPARVRRRLRRRRYEEIWIEAGVAAPEVISIDLPGGLRLSARPSSPDRRFDGRRVLLTQLRDEPFEWIADWVRLHVRNHDADAVLMFDNASQTYASADLDGLLAGLGLAAHAVVPVPFPYGNISAVKWRKRAKFLQTGVFNVARLRFLGQAAGVLRLDIDEVAWSDRGSLFEDAVRRWLGYVSLPGAWVYTAPGHAGPVRHADHVMVADPPRICFPKWCVVPTGRVGRQTWENHAIGPVPLSSLLHSRHEGFLHCRMLSTGWRGGRTRGASNNLKLVRAPRAELLQIATA